MPEVPFLVDADGPSVVSLRLHSTGDLERVVEQSRDPSSRRWTVVPLEYTLDDARRFVTEAMPAGWEQGTEWGFAVDVDGRLGGTVSLRPDGPRRAEIAYGAHPDIRGTGAMERALRLLLEWGFTECGLGTVSWWTHRGNFASRKLAWRLGFDIAPAVVRGWIDHRGELLDGYVGMLRSSDDRSPRTPWLEAPRIDSPRLPVRLRSFREDDLVRCVEAVADPAVQHWLSGVPRDPTPDAVAEDLLVAGERAACGAGLSLGVADADGLLLGRVSVFDLDRVRRCGELGFWLHPDARGRGVATEAVRLLVRHAFVPEEDGGLGLLRVYAHAAVDNVASRAVLTRAGLAEVRTVPLGTRTTDGLSDAVLHEVVA